MKILLFTLEYPPWRGGVANYYGSLVRHWPKTDGVEVLNNNHGELLKGRLPLSWLRAAVKLRQIIRTKKINHILVGQILPLGAAALICSRFYEIKYSVILHGLDFSSAVRIQRKKIITRLVLMKAEKIICANHYVANLARRTFPAAADKVMVVNPGVNKNYELRITNYESIINKYNLHNKIILLSVGRLVKRKGFDKVIEAMPEILKQAPNLVYVIIGDGNEQENFQFQISNLKLKNNIIVINNSTDEERDAWYNICDIFIMPARNIAGDFEGFGIVYLEANLAGKPVIAGRSGGAADAVVDELNGLMVEPENVNDISEKVIKLALNPELRQKLGQQGKARALKDFNWEKQAEKIYKSIM